MTINGAAVGAHGLSLRADVLELGARDGLYLGEFREFLQWIPKRGVDAGRLPEEHRSDR